MSLTNEMSRVSTQFEASQAARSAAIGAIEAAVQHDLRRGRAARSRVMAAHQKATKSHLKEIFGAAAFLRGAAGDLIERIADGHEKSSDAMRDDLRSFVQELQETVEGQLQRLTDKRSATARQEEAARRAYLKDLRRRVHAVLGNADKYIKGLHKDRTTAERVWEQHRRTSQRLREAAVNGEAAPRKRTVKAKKRQRAAHH
ncbi:MAG: hypothetical protein ACHQAY_27165 [Hyphomicrobiales bacterium]